MPIILVTYVQKLLSEINSVNLDVFKDQIANLMDCSFILRNMYINIFL